ncbi:MAG TPA: response regulator, partial [Bacteroidetes bacterium]|nr:response regulator [Bacteroidota bacterium]
MEDTKEHAKYTRLLLEKQDYTVNVVPDEETAIETLKQREPDVILMDIMLGNGNGIDFCKKLRKGDKFANIPVILLTSSNDIKTKISGFQAGADDYITKPFKIQE